MLISGCSSRGSRSASVNTGNREQQHVPCVIIAAHALCPAHALRSHAAMLPSNTLTQHSLACALPRRRRRRRVCSCCLLLLSFSGSFVHSTVRCYASAAAASCGAEMATTTATTAAAAATTTSQPRPDDDADAEFS